MSPMKAPRLCSQQGCPGLRQVGEKYCTDHAYKLKTDYPRRYPEHQKMYNAQWRKVRKMHLAGNPLCVVCGRGANVCDHIKPHKGDWLLFYSPSNLQSLCTECHNKKTGIEFSFGKASPKSYDR